MYSVFSEVTELIKHMFYTAFSQAGMQTLKKKLFWKIYNSVGGTQLT